MKILSPLFLVALVACTPTGRMNNLGEPLEIDPTRPPGGMMLIQILLENQSLPVKGTQCESGTGDNRRLQHRLAMLLGDGLDNPRVHTELLADCQPNQYDLPSGGVIDAWQCRLGVMLKADKDEFGVGGSIYFGITKDTWKLVPVPEALRCT